MAGNRAIASLVAVQRQVPPTAGSGTEGTGTTDAEETPATGTTSTEASAADGASSGAPAPPPRTRQGRIVFIMGTDRAGFYAAARRYWRAQGAEILGATSIANVFRQLRDRPQVFDEINIVCHASADGGLSCRATDTDRDRQTTYSELAELVRTSPTLFELSGQVDAASTVRIRGCNIGRGRPMVEVLDEAFGGLAQVVAPTHLEAYRWHDTNTRITGNYLTGYFLEVPGVANRTRDELVNEMVAKYPPPESMTAEQWRRFWRRNSRRLRRRVERPWVGVFNVGAPSPANPAALRRWAQTNVQVHFPGERVRRVEHVAWHLMTYTGFYICSTITPEGTRAARTIRIESPDDDTVIGQARSHHPRPDTARWEVSYTQRRNQIIGRAYAVRTEWSQRFDMPRVSQELGTPPAEDARYYTVSTYQPGDAVRPSSGPQEQTVGEMVVH